MVAASIRPRGIALIEALVALAIMALGMVAIMGVQVTLRSNGDLSRQRAEAVRIAQESLEDWRGYLGIESDADPLTRDYPDLATDGPTTIAGLNASYARTRTVVTSGSPPMKQMSVVVAWTDRTGEIQSVQLSSAVAAVPPDLVGSLALPSNGAPAKRPQGRNVNIPIPAKDLGNGISVFKPPQGSGGTVAWVFNNITGLLKACTVGGSETTNTIDLADLSSTCLGADFDSQLLSGYVRFANTGSQPDETEAEAPTGSILNLSINVQLTSTGHPGPATCFSDAIESQSLAELRTSVAYFCSIPSNTAGTWTGRSRIGPLAFTSGVSWAIVSSGSAQGDRKVCRYTPVNSATTSQNVDHPLDYTAGGSLPFASLTHQNFLVISAAHLCPEDTAAADDFVNSNTELHQDGSTTYNNP